MRSGEYSKGRSSESNKSYSEDSFEKESNSSLSLKEESEGRSDHEDPNSNYLSSFNLESSPIRKSQVKCVDIGNIAKSPPMKPWAKDTEDIQSINSHTLTALNTHSNLNVFNTVPNNYTPSPDPVPDSDPELKSLHNIDQFSVSGETDFIDSLFDHFETHLKDDTLGYVNYPNQNDLSAIAFQKADPATRQSFECGLYVSRVHNTKDVLKRKIHSEYKGKIDLLKENKRLKIEEIKKNIKLLKKMKNYFSVTLFSMLNIGSFECQLFTLKEETITAIGIKMIKNWILSYLIDLQKCYDNCSFLLNYEKYIREQEFLPELVSSYLWKRYLLLFASSTKGILRIFDCSLSHRDMKKVKTELLPLINKWAQSAPILKVKNCVEITKLQHTARGDTPNSSSTTNNTNKVSGRRNATNMDDFWHMTQYKNTGSNSRYEVVAIMDGLKGVEQFQYEMTNFDNFYGEETLGVEDVLENEINEGNISGEIRENYYETQIDKLLFDSALNRIVPGSNDNKLKARNIKRSSTVNLARILTRRGLKLLKNPVLEAFDQRIFLDATELNSSKEIKLLLIKLINIKLSVPKDATGLHEIYNSKNYPQTLKIERLEQVNFKSNDFCKLLKLTIKQMEEDKFYFCYLVECRLIHLLLSNCVMRHIGKENVKFPVPECLQESKEIGGKLYVLDINNFYKTFDMTANTKLLSMRSPFIRKLSKTEMQQIGNIYLRGRSSKDIDLSSQRASSFITYPQFYNYFPDNNKHCTEEDSPRTKLKYIYALVREFYPKRENQAANESIFRNYVVQLEEWKKDGTNGVNSTFTADKTFKTTFCRWPTCMSKSLVYSNILARILGKEDLASKEPTIPKLPKGYKKTSTLTLSRLMNGLEVIYNMENFLTFAKKLTIYKSKAIQNTQTPKQPQNTEQSYFCSHHNEICQDLFKKRNIVCISIEKFRELYNGTKHYSEWESELKDTLSSKLLAGGFTQSITKLSAYISRTTCRKGNGGKQQQLNLGALMKRGKYDIGSEILNSGESFDVVYVNCRKEVTGDIDYFKNIAAQETGLTTDLRKLFVDCIPKFFIKDYYHSLKDAVYCRDYSRKFLLFKECFGSFEHNLDKFYKKSPNVLNNKEKRRNTPSNMGGSSQMAMAPFLGEIMGGSQTHSQNRSFKSLKVPSETNGINPPMGNPPPMTTYISHEKQRTRLIQAYNSAGKYKPRCNDKLRPYTVEPSIKPKPGGRKVVALPPQNYPAFPMPADNKGPTNNNINEESFKNLKRIPSLGRSSKETNSKWESAEERTERHSLNSSGYSRKSSFTSVTTPRRKKALLGGLPKAPKTPVLSQQATLYSNSTYSQSKTREGKQQRIIKSEYKKRKRSLGGGNSIDSSVLAEMNNQNGEGRGNTPVNRPIDDLWSN